MKRKVLSIIVVTLLVFGSECVFSQYQSTTQSLVRQEFFNPAYNSFKDYYSFSTLSRWQWADVAYSPKTYAFNAYLPIKNSTFGVGPTVIKENIGLRDIVTVYGTASANVRLSRNSFLAFGLGIGIESSSYDREKLRTYLGADLFGIDYSQIDPAVSIGVMYLSAKYFAGLSTNTVFRDKSMGSTLPGFDFSAGAMFSLNENLGFKPVVVLKYYKEGSVPADGLYRATKYGELIA
ncbi:PorP/SprF family type IX secretion system membrane protein, partial [Labilibaculum sp. K2S]|uniref:PorP/SprF family type IX secretion system membrane protein n=1 Tax=Labilibaculum sp. K2S TaxID=3056386 RepID=UPI0025A493C9